MIDQGAPVPETSREDEHLMKADHDDGFAESYSTDNESSLFNAYYASPAMVELARQRLGRDADLHLADLGRPLPVSDGKFDDVIFFVLEAT